MLFRDVRTAKAKPFVKWIGGKRSLLLEIEKRLPTNFRDYYEPFVGGGALFFTLQERANHCFLSDGNADLIETYQVVREQPKDLIKALEQHQQQHEKDYYYQQRALYPTSRLGRAARLIYLNKTCFNGLYRVNQKNEWNTPIGRYAHPKICDAENLLAASAALQSATLRCCDFSEITPKSGDFVYFDPPYQPVAKNSFTHYVQNGFSENDQVRLRNFALQLTQQKVSVMISNSNSPLIQELYRESFRVEKVSAPRAVNCKGKERGKVEELLIMNY